MESNNIPTNICDG